MFLIRTHSYPEIESLRQEFENLFQELTTFEPVSHQNTWQPAIELADQEESLVLKVQLPGWNSQDLDISASRENITIQGKLPTEKESNGNKVYYSEIKRTSFQRNIKLPVAIENEQIQATYQNGILTLTLPKVKKALKQVVKVNLT